MTKTEIIRKTLQQIQVSLQNDDAELVVAELQDLLPYNGDIRTCEDFSHLGVMCCETCHGENAHYEMDLIELPYGGKAWVCHAVKQAVRSENSNEEIAASVIF